MEFIKWIFQLVVYYEKDRASGKPYWYDPAFIGLVVSIGATEAAKYAGINIDSDLQLKIVGTITGIGALLSPHTGVVQKVAPLSTAARKEAARKDDSLPNIM
jgi:hypothetical protein